MSLSCISVYKQIITKINPRNLEKSSTPLRPAAPTTGHLHKRADGQRKKRFSVFRKGKRQEV
jgi:hypothetical protein